MALKYKRVMVKLIDKNKGMFLELSKEGYKVGSIVEATEVFLDGKSKGTYYLDEGIAYEGETALKIDDKKQSTPKLYQPTQEDLSRVGNILSEYFSDDKVLVAGNEKIRGKRPSNN